MKTYLILRINQINHQIKQKISNLNRSAYGIGVGAIGAVSLLSANPLGFL